MDTPEYQTCFSIAPFLTKQVHLIYFLQVPSLPVLRLVLPPVAVPALVYPVPSQAEAVDVGPH